MYGGHLALALASTRVQSRVPLWLLLVASQGPDWVELVCSAGVAQSSTELYSHSIPAVVAGSLVIALLYAAATRDAVGSMFVAAIYLTHPVLDLVTGAKVLWPGGPMIGAGLYERPAVDFVVEGAIIVVGWLVYRSPVRNRRAGSHAVLILGTLLLGQGILDLGQELRLLRRSSDTPNWPFAATRRRPVPIIARGPEGSQFVARTDAGR